MDDPDDPYSRDNLSWNWRFGGPKWRPFSGRWMRGPRVPPPPWARKPPKASKAEREQEKRAEARAERLHLAGLTSAAVITMGVVPGAMVIVLAVVLVSRGKLVPKAREFEKLTLMPPDKRLPDLSPVDRQTREITPSRWPAISASEDE